MGTRKRAGKGHDKKSARARRNRRRREERDGTELPSSGVDSDSGVEDIFDSDIPKNTINKNKPKANGHVTTQPRDQTFYRLSYISLGLVLLSAGICVYYFVDVQSLIGTAQTRGQDVPDSSPEVPKPVDIPLASETQPAASKTQPAASKTQSEQADKKPETSDDSSTIKKGYAKADITNPADNKIRGDLDNAESWILKRRPDEAIVQLDRLLSRYPKSPRATFLKGEALCLQAELQMSNSLLEQCIEQYLKVLDLPDVPRPLVLKAGRTCAGRQEFRGWAYKAAKVLKRLLDLYPDEYILWNELGVKYLMTGRNEEARSAFNKMLSHVPDDPYATAHLGFIMKTGDNNPEMAIPYLRRALLSGDKSIRDGRFFFHLGDALQRVGNVTEAHEWYQKGADYGLFRSKWQRSLYNVDHIQSRPWWTHAQLKQPALIKSLEQNWKVIRDEGLANLDKGGSFKPEEENLREKGDWRQLTLFQQGRKVEQNCKKAPKTCALIEKFPDSAGCKRGQVKFSVMQPGVHVWPHCGPTNCRIRAHLGLVVPEDCCKIRVGEDTRTWQEGKVVIFDDSFEHEVWHNGSSFRLVLIFDVWHPDLTQREKTTLTPI